MSSILHLTTQEYGRMVECGAFDGLNKKIELIRGAIVEMNPAGAIHDDFVEYLRQWSSRLADATRFQVRGQTGMDLPELDSRPEPDIFWVTAGRYLENHPSGKDTHLAIEVADSSLKKDRTVKAELYADAGIAEYWIVDVQHRCIHLFREAVSGGDYGWRRTAKLGDEISPLVQPDAVLNVSELFAEDHA